VLLKLYEDKGQTFKCKLKIEGAELSKAKARMVLSGTDMDYIFNGVITKNGNCNIKFPALENFNSGNGNAVLEVIVENGIFEPLKMSYEVKKHNIVNVSEIQLNDDKASPSVVINEIDIESETKFSDNGLIKENISSRDHKLIKEIIGNYNVLDKKVKRKMANKIKKYHPDDGIVKWSKNVFNNVNSFSSKLCMYAIQNK